MLSDSTIVATLERSRGRLSAWVAAIAAGKVPAGLPQSVRMENDLLVSLLDESPPVHHEAINYLIDRCDALVARLSN